MTFIVPSLLSSNAQAKKPLDQKVTDKKSWGMHIDVDKCVDGCTACVDACNEENGLTGFGPGGEGFVRFALVENEHRIRQAITQLGAGLENLT